MSIRSINPSTGEVLKTFEEMPAQEIESRLAAAHAAFQKWRKIPATERAELLRRLADTFRANMKEMAEVVSKEMGMIYAESEVDVDYCAGILDYYAENGPVLLADQRLETPFGQAFNSFDPLGVILSVQPWNFPYSQAVRAMAPALMAGNSMLLKHASNVTMSALTLEKMFREAGGPEGLFSVLILPGAKATELVADPRIAGVTLTGSETAGSSLAAMAGKSIKPCVMELGGNDAFIVLDDADLDAAAAHGVFGRVYNSGQVCTSPKRIIVVQAVLEAFMAKAKAICEGLKVGDPFEAGTQVQPMSSETQLKIVLAQLEANIKAGARLVCGGKRLDRPGWFMEPALLADMRPGMPAYAEEVFGPVVCVYAAPDEAAAVAMANDSRYGLGGTVFSADEARAVKVARQIDTGMVYINHVSGTSPELPFGGTKRSGFGRELSPSGLYLFVNAKLIRVTTPDQPY